MKYSALVALHDNATPADQASYKELIEQETAVTGTLNVLQEAVTARAKRRERPGSADLCSLGYS
ncbi:hypothetical protein ACFSQ7_45870 [Paenibacillus rhizoplanae]